MQTTLRIDDALYREAKAEAARSGVSLTRFIEEGLRLRLRKNPPEERRTPVFRVYHAQQPDQRAWEAILKVAEEEQSSQEMDRLGIKPGQS